MKTKSFILLVMVFILLSGCNKYKVNSIYNKDAIVIDGNGEEWENSKYYIKDHDAVFGVMNDDEFLYLYFYPTTSVLNRQMLSEGLTLWVNGVGKKKEELGLRIIPDIQDFKKDRFRKRPDTENTSEITDNIETDLMKLKARSLPIKLQILKPERDVVRFSNLSKLKGIEIGTSSKMDLFAYEIKFPLKGNPKFPVYIDADPRSLIEIGFEIPEPEMEEKRQGMEDSERPLMDSGSGGGRGKAGGMGRGSGRSERQRPAFESLKLWTKIQLVQN